MEGTLVDKNAAHISRRGLLGAGALAAGAAALPAVRADAAAKPATTPVTVVPEPPQVPAKEGLFDAGGARLWYWDTGGDGQAVVFLHPGTGNGTSWVYQQPVFAKAGYRVIGYSRRGSFKSETDANAPPAAGPMTAQDIEDLYKLATHLSLGRFHLVGIAAGGFVAAHYAVNFPETLRSVVLGCSLMSIQDPDYQALTTKVQAPNMQSTPSEFKELSAAYRTLNPEGTERWIEIEKKNPRAAMGPGAPVPGLRAGGPAGDRGAAGGAAPLPPPGGASTPGGRKATNFTTLREMSTRVPTLLMTGDADLYFNPGLLHYVGQRVPAAKRLVLEYSGHAPFWEQPTEFNRMILEFIRSHRR
jgi:pimeloyl-ACP methyl ester carboxylesterase